MDWSGKMTKFIGTTIFVISSSEMRGLWEDAEHAARMRRSMIPPIDNPVGSP